MGKRIYSNISNNSNSSRTENCSQSYNVGANESQSGDCSRFCRNVCRRLWPLQVDQCVNDCLACQDTIISETDEEYLDED